MRRSFNSPVRIVLVVCLLSVTARVAAGAEKTTATKPARVKITISKETTHILGPVNKDGTVNYVAYLDAKLSKGVTPKNNAVVLLAGAIGPELFPPILSAKAFKRLGMKAPPARGDYFVELDTYVEALVEKGEVESGPESSDLAEQTKKDLQTAMTAPWSAKDYPILAGWLRANKKPLALAVAATGRPRWYMPVLARGDPPEMVLTMFPSLGPCREIAKALGARAMKRFRSGDFEGARSDVNAAHRLGRFVSRGATFIERYVGIAIENIGFACARGMARSGKLSAAQARTLLGDLKRLDPLPRMVDVIDEEERFFGLDCVMMLARGGEPLPLRFLEGPKGKPLLPWLFEGEKEGQPRGAIPAQMVDWNAVLRRWNALHDIAVKAMRVKGYVARSKRIRAASVRLDKERLRARLDVSADSLKGLRAKLTTPNDKKAREHVTRTVGSWFIFEMMGSSFRASSFIDKIVAQKTLTEVALGLAGHRADKGNYPAKLAQLRPKYLKTIPKDLFTERPLIYKRRGAGYVLYSVGPNMKDDGGVEESEDGADDIVVTTVKVK